MAESSQKTVFDPTQQHLGAIYARALLGATEKVGNTESVLEELEALTDEVLVKVPQLEGTLTSPRIPVEAKHVILDRAFADKLTRELLIFLKVVARRGRFDCLHAIARACRMQYNEMRGRVEVQVRSASTLDAAARQQVADRLQSALGREVDLRLDVDPNLIAGLVVRVGDTLYDGSVANRLLKLREDMFSRATERIRGDLERFAVAAE